MSIDLVRIFDAVCESNVFQLGAGKMAQPVVNGALGLFRPILVGLGGGEEKIDVGEGIVEVHDRDRAVQKGFHLASHSVEVQRGGKYQHVCIVHFVDEPGGFIVMNAGMTRAAAETSVAVFHGDIPELDELGFIAGLFCAPLEFQCHFFRIPIAAKTGGDD